MNNASLRVEEHSLQDLKDAVAIKYISHFKGEFKNCLFLETLTKENKLIYPAANTIAFNSLSASFQNDRSQSFQTTLPGSKGILCMAQSPNKRYLAWAQQTQKSPVIYLLDLANPSKKRAFAIEIKSRKYICLAFNGNEITQPKFLVGLTNGPQYQLVQWNFEKGKFLTFPIEKVQKLDKQGNISYEKFNQIFFYREQDTIVAMGKGNFKFYKLTPEKLQLKDSPFARREINQKDYNFTAYCILKDGLIVGTDNGELLYFAANGEFKYILADSPGQSFTIETLIHLPNSNKSFIAGGSDGMLILYQKSQLKDPRSLYSKSSRNLSIGKDYKQRVTSLLTTPKEDELFIGLHSGVILKMSLEKADKVSYEHAIQSFHTDTINGLDICLRKSLVGTCSADRSVRIWNYLEKNNLEVSKSFEEKPLSLSFHPSGLYLLVSFPDKVRMINILNNQLVNCKDLSIKNCYEVKFSNGGHLFAVVNNVMVQIFNFYNLDQPSHYQFKAPAGKFQAMVWEEDDLAIYLGTSDGFVFYYKLQDSTCRLQVLAVPGFSVRTLSCLFVGKDEKQGVINERTVYAGGTFNNSVSEENKCIYQIKITPKTEKDNLRQASLRQDLNKYNISIPNKIYTNCNVSKIIMLNSKKVFLYATDEPGQAASIRYCRYPFHLNKQIYDIQAHTAHITKMAISYDDNYIFSVGEEGQFVCYQFKDKESKVKVQMPDFSEEFLYSKPQLLRQKAQQQDYKQKNTEAREKRDKTIRQTKVQNEIQIGKWDRQIKQREKIQKQKYDKQVDLIGNMEKDQSRQLVTLQRQHRERLQTVQKDYEDKIHLQQTRFSDLGKNKETENKKFTEIIQKIKSKHIKEKQDKQIMFQRELQKQKQQLRHFDRIYEEDKKKYEEGQQKVQNEAEKEIKIKKEEDETGIEKLKFQNNLAETEKRTKKNLYDKQDRLLEEEKHKLKHTLEDIDKIKQQHQQNLQKKQSQAKEIVEREKTIRDKMTRINELKKKTQQLQKFKFVLDYKIKELKRDIGPKEEEIAQMKEQIANMNAEIIHFKRTNDNMKLIVKDLVSKRGGMQNQIDGLNLSESQNLNYIKSFEYDLSDMHQNCLNDYKQLKNKVVELYRKYVQQENKKKMEGIDQQKEFIKQRAHLQSTVKGLKQKFKKSISLHEQDNKRIMGQNEELISEINDLKRDKKNLKDEIKKRHLMKEMMSKLQEEKYQVQKEYEHIQKTVRQLKLQHERMVKRKQDRIEA